VVPEESVRTASMRAASSSVPPSHVPRAVLRRDGGAGGSRAGDAANDGESVSGRMTTTTARPRKRFGQPIFAPVPNFVTTCVKYSSVAKEVTAGGAVTSEGGRGLPGLGTTAAIAPCQPMLDS
jgi:hypothetical protein